MNEAKPFWMSKTLWFNVLAAIVIVAGMFGFAEFEADPELVTLITVVANIVLRAVTKQPITFDPPATEA